MASPRPSTPPPPPSPSHIATPPTPRFGYCDHWDPYAQTRRSTRLASSSRRCATARTPSPPPLPRTETSSPRKSKPDAAMLLPTPAKTPSKPDRSVQNERKIGSIAKNLFGGKPKDEPLQIFTDSRDRVPVKDDSAANPFYGDILPPAPRVRAKRSKVTVPGEGRVDLTEALRREDGIVYSFRGKKIFRKFAETDDDDNDDNETEQVPNFSRPFTRSQMKPRLLFPPQPKTDAQLQQEEADTDVDEDAILPKQQDAIVEQQDSVAAAGPQTPRQPKSETPKAPRFAPMSPPSTRRTTRSSAHRIADSDTPVVGKRLFDHWPRTKATMAAAAGVKRPAVDDELVPTATAIKRARN